MLKFFRQGKGEPYLVYLRLLMNFWCRIAQRFPCFHYLAESGAYIVAKSNHTQHLLNRGVAS